MNTKIYDAMMKTAKTPAFINEKHYWPPEYVERFALLIARLCAEAADQAQEADVKYPGDYVMESLGFTCSDRSDPEPISPLLLKLAANAKFDITQYDPNKDIEGLPMTFIQEYGELIVKECAKIAGQCRYSGIQDIPTVLLSNFQLLKFPFPE